MKYIKTIKVDRDISIDLDRNIYDKLISKYAKLTEFIERLKYFISNIATNKDRYNINPSADKIKKGIYILGKHDSELGIFPNSYLALKCSQNKPLAENLSKQFYRSIQLAEIFQKKLNSEQKSLLEICPVYLYVKNRSPNSFFKQIIFMEKVADGTTLGNTKLGFAPEFCQAFKIPTLEEIATLSEFALHRYLDRDKQRQLLKIQTAYLFQRLWFKGIKILSLNQNNVLVSHDRNTDQTKYIIIDPTADYSLPISPIYNSLNLLPIGLATRSTLKKSN